MDSLKLLAVFAHPDDESMGMGGTLSHGAIIAREYGLPVLVNVPYATSLLRENEQVEIASSTGRISRLVS